jgi:hypothetical protein
MGLFNGGQGVSVHGQATYLAGTGVEPDGQGHHWRMGKDYPQPDSVPFQDLGSFQERFIAQPAGMTAQGMGEVVDPGMITD